MTLRQDRRVRRRSFVDGQSCPIPCKFESAADTCCQSNRRHYDTLRRLCGNFSAASMSLFFSHAVEILYISCIIWILQNGSNINYLYLKPSSPIHVDISQPTMRLYAVSLDLISVLMWFLLMINDVGGFGPNRLGPQYVSTAEDRGLTDQHQ